ncbi:MAG TPA: hypothetical protein VND65_18300, partial [Candidatus Binatia bacterium]|nr:hypothetical protein [Candidatus Binatia bacterium]
MIGILGGMLIFAASPDRSVSGPDPINVSQVGASAVALGSTTSSASLPTVQATNQGNPCYNPNSTPTSSSGATSGTSATQLIALSSGKQIFLCAFTLTAVSGTNPTYKIVYGTGTNCGSGQVTLVGPSAVSTAGQIFSYPNAFIVPAGNAL